jgi:Tol biopolymer transport system component
MGTSRIRGKHAACFVLVASCFLGLFAPQMSQALVWTQRVSLAADGSQAADACLAPSISADGRFVAFHSQATTLVPGDTNSASDVFVRDRLLGTTERVSVGKNGAQGDEGSYSPSISADGRFVAFNSLASNLVNGDGNLHNDVFVRDRLLGITRLVSIRSNGTQGNADSWDPAVSADGNYVAYVSAASSLWPDDTNGVVDVFVSNIAATSTERVSIPDGYGQQGNGSSAAPSVSSDGRYVAFSSNAANLTTGDTNAVADIFLRDREAGQTWRLSLSTSDVQGNHASGNPSVSSDGTFIAFQSLATNLVSPATSGSNVFIRSLLDHKTDLVSVSTGTSDGNLDSVLPAISADTRYIAFCSDATNLVSSDTNSKRDVFVRDRLGGVTQRVSVASSGAQAGDDSGFANPPATSVSGRYVAFDSIASNLVTGDTNGDADVFVADRNKLTYALYPSSAKWMLTFWRHKRIARFTLAVTVRDSLGVRIPNVTVRLQSSANGRTRWRTVSTRMTNYRGVASKPFVVTKRSTAYYRWVLTANEIHFGRSTRVQKVRVR